MKLTQILKEIKITQPTLKTPLNIKSPKGAEDLKATISDNWEGKTFELEINGLNVGKFYISDGGPNGLIITSSDFDWDEKAAKMLDTLLWEYSSQINIDTLKIKGKYEVQIEVLYDNIGKLVSINGQPYIKSFYDIYTPPTFSLREEEKSLVPLNINITDITSPTNIRKDIVGIMDYLSQPSQNHRLPRSIKGSAEIRGDIYPFTMYLDSGVLGAKRAYPYDLVVIFADMGDNMDYLVKLFRKYNLDYKENMVDPENYYSIILSLKPGQMNLVKYHGKTLPPDINTDEI